MTTAGETGEYTYISIQSDQFRLVEVQSLEPEIRIKLTEHSDNLPPGYFALSYAWGSESNTEHVLCNGMTFRITPHLKEGLEFIFNTCGGSYL